MMILLKFILSLNLAFACDQDSLEVESGFRTHLPDKNTSQLMRSNAKQFWHWIATRSSHFGETYGLFKIRGMVFGDAHISNFAVIPILKSLRFVFFDFDDGGFAPFFADFSRFAAITKATFPKVKLQKLLEAHIKGLRGDYMPMPEKLKAALEMSYDRYLKKRRSKIDEARNDNKILLNRPELKPATPSELTAVGIAFSAAMPGMEIVDIVRFVKPRGGSAESLRYWVLVKTRNPDLPMDLFEVKELIQPGTESFGFQESGAARLESQKKAFWPELDPQYSSTRIFDKDFEIRPKKVNLYHVNADDFKSFAIYTAYTKGRVYAAQAASKPYSEILQSRTDGVLDLVKHIVRDYRDIADKTLDTSAPDQD